MSRVRIQPPTREHLEQLWLSPEWTVRMIAARFHVSETLVALWAKTFGFRHKRNTCPMFVTRRKAEHFNDSTAAVQDGPMWGDPTTEEISELAAYCRARRVMQGETCYVYIEQPIEDEAWAA
jgi:hypothetical protein